MTNTGELVLWGTFTAAPHSDMPVKDIRDISLSHEVIGSDNRSRWVLLSKGTVYAIEITKDLKPGAVEKKTDYAGKVTSIAEHVWQLTATVDGKAISWPDGGGLVEGKEGFKSEVKMAYPTGVWKSDHKLYGWDCKTGKKPTWEHYTPSGEYVGVNWGPHARAAWRADGQLHLFTYKALDIGNEFNSGVTDAVVIDSTLGPYIDEAFVLKNGQVYHLEIDLWTMRKSTLLKELGTGIVQVATDGHCVIALRRVPPKVNNVWLTSGCDQKAQVGTVFAQPVKGRARLDQTPVQGHELEFSLPDGNNTGSHFHGKKPGDSVRGITDTKGETSVTLVAGSEPGKVTVKATSVEYPHRYDYCHETVTAAPKTTVDKVVAVAGDGQTTQPGQTFAEALKAKATLKDKPVPDTTLTFTIRNATSTGATFTGGKTQAQAPTGSDGVATSPKLKAGPSYTGAITVTAASQDHPDRNASFTLNVAKTTDRKPVKSIASQQGSGQSVPVNTKVPTQITVVARDNEGNPVPGARIKFAAPATLTFKDAQGNKVASCEDTTNSQGAAGHPLDLWTLDEIGDHQLTVTAPDKQDQGANPAHPKVKVIK